MRGGGFLPNLAANIDGYTPGDVIPPVEEAHDQRTHFSARPTGLRSGYSTLPTIAIHSGVSAFRVLADSLSLKVQGVPAATVRTGLPAHALATSHRFVVAAVAYDAALGDLPMPESVDKKVDSD